MISPLPVIAVLPELLGVLSRGSSVVLKASTGAGKTTLVPPALLDAGFADQGWIVVLEPRRLAAQSSARFMASERQEPIGRTFGYHIRFDRQVSRQTRIIVVTEGIFLRMLLDDPLLERVAVVVFDEFHERSLSSDLALALTRRLQTQFRPELKIAVMSATFDPQAIARFLDCPVVSCEGRLFPVEVRNLRFPSQHPMHVEAAAGVKALLAETAGDVLVFLPGVGEIRRTRAELAELADPLQFDLLDLYGDLPADRQEAVLRPQSRRKVILATNVAETSVTIPGVTAVVDTGFARILRCDPAVGLNRLERVRISRASADQRAGRAGRTQPGVCLRLWSAEEWRMFKELDLPEILRLDLSGAVLQLHAWGESRVREFPWFQPPPGAAIDQAESLLQRLGAVDGERITDRGLTLARLPVHPRLARLLVEGEQRGCAKLAALAAALLSERDPLQRDGSRPLARHNSPSDVLDRIQALQAFENSHVRDSVVGVLQVNAAQHVFRVRDQLLRELAETSNTGDSVRSAEPVRGSAETRLLQSLVAAFPDRVARRRDRHGLKGVMVGGRGVRLADWSAVREGALFLCVDIEEVGATEALVRQASRVEREWLSPERTRSRVEVEFDDERERVLAFQRIRYEDLLIEEAATDPPDSDEVSERLAQAAAEQLDRALPLLDEPVAQFLARVRCLGQWMPELQLPAIDDDALGSLLPQLARGKRSFAELRKMPLAGFLRQLLSGSQLAALDREAPESIPAASGSRIRLHYEVGRPPTMPVRIQEMFGQSQTPRIAAGRVTVLLHLLAPNMRTQQVTDDLRGFWERTYPIVRKELRRRYPKHSWPDDPAHAAAERRPARKPPH